MAQGVTHHLQRPRGPAVGADSTSALRAATTAQPGGNYTFTLNSFRITDTRSVHNDTDFVAIAVAVGNKPPITAPTVSMGDVNNGTHTVNVSIPNVVVGRAIG